MELRFAVVEDRLPDAQRLESLLRLAFGGGQPLVCDHYESGDAFLAAFPSKEYQVIFLDICMEGTNGIETARILRRADPDLLLVFVTSSPEYVWDAFPVHPFDYLLKPYREEKLFQLADELRSSPTISYDGTIYVNGMKDDKPTVFAVKGAAEGCAASWSQQGGNPSKTEYMY
jgi:two-component system LytT family response regulator